MRIDPYRTWPGKSAVRLLSVSDDVHNPLQLQLSPADAWYTCDGLSTFASTVSGPIGGRQCVTLGLTCAASIEALKQLDAAALEFALQNVGRIWGRVTPEQTVRDMFSPAIRHESALFARLRARMDANTLQAFTADEVVPPVNGSRGVLNLHRRQRPPFRGQRCLVKVRIPHLWFSFEATGSVPKSFGLTVEITHMIAFKPEQTPPDKAFDLMDASVRLHAGPAIDSRANEAIAEIEKLLEKH